MNGETMSNLTPEFPKHNGSGRHGRRKRDLAAKKAWLADLDAALDEIREREFEAEVEAEETA
jgi:hypothetical protein